MVSVFTLVDVDTVALVTDAHVLESSIAAAFERSDVVLAVGEGVTLVHSGGTLVQVHAERLAIATEALFALLNSSRLTPPFSISPASKAPFCQKLEHLEKRTDPCSGKCPAR